MERWRSWGRGESVGRRCWNMFSDLAALALGAALVTCLRTRWFENSSQDESNVGVEAGAKQ